MLLPAFTRPFRLSRSPGMGSVGDDPDDVCIWCGRIGHGALPSHVEITQGAIRAFICQKGDYSCFNFSMVKRGIVWIHRFRRRALLSIFCIRTKANGDIVPSSVGIGALEIAQLFINGLAVYLSANRRPRKRKRSASPAYGAAADDT